MIDIEEKKEAFLFSTKIPQNHFFKNEKYQ